MSRFDERDLVRVGDPKCLNCKYCMVSRLDNNDGYADTAIWVKVYHCMLDVSAEDRKFVEKEIDEYGGYASEVHFTDRFNQIMKMKSEDRNLQWLDESEREVSSGCCCQFYEEERDGTV